jgi:hypothetical protein
MPLYLQFILGLMVAYATAMTVLTGLVAMDGGTGVVFTLSVAAFVWAFALVAVPTWLGGQYVSDTDGDA